MSVGENQTVNKCLGKVAVGYTETINGRGVQIRLERKPLTSRDVETSRPEMVNLETVIPPVSNNVDV